MSDHTTTIRAALSASPLTPPRMRKPLMDDALAALDALEAEHAEALEVLERVHANAVSWHGNGEEGPRRALSVIADWTRHALNGETPTSIRAMIEGENGDPRLGADLFERESIVIELNEETP